MVAPSTRLVTSMRRPFVAERVAATLTSPFLSGRASLTMGIATLGPEPVVVGVDEMPPPDSELALVGCDEAFDVVLVELGGASRRS